MKKRPDELHKTPTGLLDSVLSVRYMYLCFKIGRKIRIFSLGRKKQHYFKKRSVNAQQKKKCDKKSEILLSLMSKLRKRICI